ncbi:hypothetical protein [Janibacter limosus]|uniref:Serine hydrolase n=1 Tax=Janibacter limosus TaxID=53458 RepID=A0A4P6MZP0_9MICO|nr:hypothetical protein [Janibacter limosus]QBF47500.1 hypothetical protein EXU32_15330 [Janibacter limosus]
MARRLLAAGVGVLVALTTACTGSPARSDGATSPRTSSSTSTASTTAPTGRPATALARSLGRVIGAHPEAEIAVAWSPVGTKGAVRVVGDAQPLVAWSTIKVPLALAVVRAGHGQQMGPDIDRALTASDNEAAGRLWADLGGGHRAATAVEVQLERGRDRRTGVPPRVTVPGYSPFGQSTWRLTDQTRFTAALPCLAGSTSITQAMGRVADGQRWGLGGIDGARYKGGWGPTPGGYVVRQLGIVTGAKGATAVTLQVRAGNHQEGIAVADELVEALRSHRGDLPTGHCP